MPIRTLLFSTLYPSAARPRHGLFVETRLRRLLATGEIESTVVAPVPWFPFRDARFGSWAAMAATPAHEFRQGIEIEHPRYPLPPRIGMSMAPLLLALGAYPTIRRLLDAGRDFELIDAHYYYPDGVAAALLAAWLSKPFIVTARGSDLNVLAEHAVPRRWIRWAEARASASILVSRSLRKRLLALGGDPERMHVLPNGVDLVFFRPMNSNECRRRLGLGEGRWLLSVGNLVPLKGHDIAIEGLAALSAEFRLAIVGEGPERDRLKRLAAKRGVSDRVHFVGTVTQDKLVTWYGAADVLVLCSSHEGSPNVVLEALACGTPVAATAVGGIPEVLGAKIAGRLLAERTADALAAVVRQICATPVRRESVREHALKFDWAATTLGQIDLFRAVLDARGSPAAGT